MQCNASTEWLSKIVQGKAPIETNTSTTLPQIQDASTPENLQLAHYQCKEESKFEPQDIASDITERVLKFQVLKEADSTIDRSLPKSRCYYN